MEEAFFKEGNDVGVLVIHGFTGSPGSMRDLAQFYADQGFTVALPRLAGHGTTPEDLETASNLCTSMGASIRFSSTDL